jgi:hypothetical protein
MAKSEPQTNNGYVGRLVRLLRDVHQAGHKGITQATLRERQWAVVIGTHQGKFKLSDGHGNIVAKVPREAFQLDPKTAPPERVWVLIGTYQGALGGVLLTDPTETLTPQGTFDGFNSVPVEYVRADQYPAPRPKPKKEGK